MTLGETAQSAIAWGWGAAATFLACFAIVTTKQWHGRLTLDAVYGVQKIHEAPTPRVGGIGIVLGVLIAWANVTPATKGLLTAMLLACAPAFVFGLAEDLTKRVGVRERLLATAASGVLACLLTGQGLSSVRVWGIDFLLTWWPLSVALTAFAVAGIANAVNIIDGANGLASGVLLVCLSAFAAAAYSVGDAALGEVCLVLCAVLVGFLVVNFPLGKIFLGDGGAYVLGFWLGWIAVLLPARNSGFSPWASLLICAYPVLEVLFSIARRLSSNTSPGSADGRHLHSMLRVLMAQSRGAHWPAYWRNAAVSPVVWLFAAVPAFSALILPHHTIGMALLFIGCASLYAIVYVGLLIAVGDKLGNSAATATRANVVRGKKVLFINRFFYPDNSATSQILSDLAFHLVKEGVQVEVIASRRQHQRDDMLPAREIVQGVRVRRVWSSQLGRRSLIGRACDYLVFYIGAARAMWQMADARTIVVAKTDPPLLSVMAAPIARLRGAKLVNWLQDIFPEVASALGVGRLPAPLMRLLQGVRNASLRTADANVVLGGRMQALVCRQGVRSEKLHIIHNWADSQGIQPIDRDANPIRDAWGLTNKFVVGYSGNLGRAHEYRSILDAAALLQAQGRTEIVFLFIGGGVRREALEEEVRTAGLHSVQFMPYQSRGQLSQSLSAADVHLVSLNPLLEGLIVPSKFYGVAAAGRPSIFIGDADGEIPRILRDGQCGFSVASNEPERLASIIADLSDDPELCKELGLRARSLLETQFERGVAMSAWKKVLDCPDLAS